MEVPTNVLQWKALAEKYAKLHPILEPNEILAIIWSESTGDPNAVNMKDPSFGLMQVEMPIAKMFGGVTNLSQLYDPDTNVKCGAGFLALLKTKYSAAHDNWVTGYNQGEPNLKKGLKDQNYWDAFVSHLNDLNDAERIVMPVQ